MNSDGNESDAGVTASLPGEVRPELGFAYIVRQQKRLRQRPVLGETETRAGAGSILDQTVDDHLVAAIGQETAPEPRPQALTASLIARGRRIGCRFDNAVGELVTELRSQEPRFDSPPLDKQHRRLWSLGGHVFAHDVDIPASTDPRQGLALVCDNKAAARLAPFTSEGPEACADVRLDEPRVGHGIGQARGVVVLVEGRCREPDMLDVDTSVGILQRQREEGRD